MTWRGFNLRHKGREATPAPNHAIPTKLVLAGSCVVPVAVAVVNYVMVEFDRNIITYKLQLVHTVFQDSGLLCGSGTLVGWCVALAFMATAMVNFLAPMCVGSGIPEVLSFLNGNHSPGVFTFVSFCVRVVGIILVQGAGYPVGREGPMVGVGGCIGYGIASLVLSSYERAVEAVHASSASEGGKTGEEFLSVTSSAYTAIEEKITHIKRAGCAIGGAAGIATAFNAPIGGILYMMEEMAVSSLVPDLAKLVCTALASITARFMLNVTNMDVHKLVIYNSEAENTLAWGWSDIPMFMLLAAFLGCGASFFCRASLASWSFRKKTYGKLPKQCFSAVRIAECMVYVAVCSSAWALLPAMFPCVDVPVSDASSSSGGRLSEDVDFTQYTCDEGQYNELATLFLNSAEGAVKHLYSRAGHDIGCGPLLVGLAAYAVLAAGMPGLAVPMGTFVPNMLLGAYCGRIAGQLVQGFLGFTFASPGVYAAVGSAAMLAGFTHMTLGIVALLAEAINDFGLVVPLMLSAFVAHGVATSLSHHGYDEELIIRKGVAFLDAEMPAVFDDTNITAGTVAHRLVAECRLRQRARVEDLKKALRHKDVQFYPVLSQLGDTCLGVTTRGRLRAVLAAVHQNRKARKMLISAAGYDVARVNSTDSNDSKDSKGVPKGDVMTAQPSEDSLHSTSDNWQRQTSKTSDTSIDSTGSMVDYQPTTEENNVRLGALTDNATEVRVRDFIKTMFTKKQVDDDEHCQPHVDDSNRLDLTMITDPAPFILYEDAPVSRFYSMFKAGALVVAVISRSGRFSGIISRRGLIDAAARLHAGVPMHPSAWGAQDVTKEENPEPASFCDTDTLASPPTFCEECSDDTRIFSASTSLELGAAAMGLGLARGSTPVADPDAALHLPPHPVAMRNPARGGLNMSPRHGMQEMDTTSLEAQLHSTRSNLADVEERERRLKERLAELAGQSRSKGSLPSISTAESDLLPVSHDYALAPCSGSTSRSKATLLTISTTASDLAPLGHDGAAAHSSSTSWSSTISSVAPFATTGLEDLRRDGDNACRNAAVSV